MPIQRLLTTDLDGTFLGDDSAMRSLWEELRSAGIAVAFSTGRHLRSIEAYFARQPGTYQADACLCMVGTEIFTWQDGRYVLDTDWQRVIGRGWNHGAIHRLMRDIPMARPQADEWQSPFKCSYHLDTQVAPRLQEIRGRLAAHGLKAKVIHSAGEYLDLIPARAGKGEALRYLARAWELPADAVITAGDTGNDLDMMRADLGFRAIVVGNASPELACQKQPHIYHARAKHAAGIREGLRHYGWL
ncbi:MAG: HAD-IIB family hydrolase [Phycisphaerales bacterium]|nr:HAD-IIB family hydrolase [Phycisphaerales bacterium]